MVICDLCKRDPVATEKNEVLKREPWGVMLTPPVGSALPEKRLCWRCTVLVFNGWVAFVDPPESEPEPTPAPVLTDNPDPRSAPGPRPKPK